MIIMKNCISRNWHYIRDNMSEEEAKKKIIGLFKKGLSKYDVMDEAIYSLKENPNIRVWDSEEDHTILHMRFKERAYISEKNEKWCADALITCLKGMPETALLYLENGKWLLSKILSAEKINKVETDNEIIFERGT